MFRAQQNAFDEVVAKATDENLTSENWEYIMDVCDKVSGEDSGAKDAVASMIKRLAHRNANVQLYTLELANALSQNCGAKMHRELASRAFTDALLRLANDRNTHQQVKTKILERMAEWAEMFKDPDLGIMNDQYHRLKSQNPNLHPPSAPSKSRLTDLDRQKEEEELQMALKLSIQDKSSQPKPSQPSSSSADPAQSQQDAQPQQVPSGTTAATVSRVRALHNFQPTDADELQFRKGDIITVIGSVYKDWWRGSLRGKTGIFPLNYVEKLVDPTPEELQREAQMEAEVFAEIKNVEKLLTLLSTSTSQLDARDNEEITKLYHSTLAIRPKLIELIGKYSQKKDDFTQLNERFIKSCRDYENLLDASMTQAQSYHYGRPGQAPQGPQGYGYPPQAARPQQEPQRYYTPSQQEPPYQQQPTPPSGYAPPRNGPAPFYVVAPGQQPLQADGRQPYPGQQAQQSESQQPYPQRDPTPRIPSGSQPPPLQTNSPPPTQYPTQQPQTGHRPQSTYSNPQELATSVYDSPVQQQNPHQYTTYGETDPYPATPATAQSPQQYNAYKPSQQPSQPPQPSFEPPAPPNEIPSPVQSSPYPGLGDARTTLPSQGQYKAYQRPDSSDSNQGMSGQGLNNAPSAPPAGASNPADFYRQNTAY
ncbi:a959f9e6-f22b-4f29-b60a-499027c784a7 [Sclerotinia trifoliorum]|uniref:Class E vacuolar protein-sorting machinery protein HSE1 n=1 Tax=Sclerotinia trifoliorum TaxID=28548 RepID=A0A8H2W413_9HELO|nr:a959f9e6-f22b-4f29-b60a-499027c784a7 [Sclerotinia trifoliorum]